MKKYTNTKIKNAPNKSLEIKKINIPKKIISSGKIYQIKFLLLIFVIKV